MNEAVRRFRRRFDGCDSSFLGLMLVNALRELPKMLRRLSLDMVNDYLLCWRAPPLARSAAVLAHAESHEQLRKIGARSDRRTNKQGGAVAKCRIRRPIVAQITVAWGDSRRFGYQVLRYTAIRGVCLSLRSGVLMVNCSARDKSWQSGRHGLVSLFAGHDQPAQHLALAAIALLPCISPGSGDKRERRGAARRERLMSPARSQARHVLSRPRSSCTCGILTEAAACRTRQRASQRCNGGEWVSGTNARQRDRGRGDGVPAIYVNPVDRSEAEGGKHRQNFSVRRDWPLLTRSTITLAQPQSVPFDAQKQQDHRTGCVMA